MKYLVVGGAGYIGSHMVKHLLHAGHEVVVADLEAPVPGLQWVCLDIADGHGLDTLFSDYHFDAVFHFASFIQVGESVADPDKYYLNNVCATLSLLEAMVRAGVKRLIFSSSAAVYGDPEYVPIDEQHPKVPINPYGRSKWMVEQMLEDFDRAYGLRSVSLRYFNAAGADPDG
ncbi:MAG: NAD-dependent epimerase/dehydratase family protein, partial [Pseudomonas sp.]|uniref:NAD-dependent epimerase/dehydratase family protein n=2 Tax=Pseudomonas TaxID=286 RepID=UPI003314781F